jgi:hypothetical protein
MVAVGVLVWWLSFALLVPLFSISSVCLGCFVPTILLWKIEKDRGVRVTKVDWWSRVMILVGGVVLLGLCVYCNIVNFQ